MLGAYLLGQVPAGVLADRHGGLSVLLWGLALWSCATALTAAAPGAGPPAALPVLYASRVLLGAASACAMPCVSAAAVAWVPPRARAAAISLIYAFFNIGGRAPWGAWTPEPTQAGILAAMLKALGEEEHACLKARKDRHAPCLQHRGGRGAPAPLTSPTLCPNPRPPHPTPPHPLQVALWGLP
jgi:hypothetical protein